MQGGKLELTNKFKSLLCDVVLQISNTENTSAPNSGIYSGSEDDGGELQDQCINHSLPSDGSECMFNVMQGHEDLG